MQHDISILWNEGEATIIVRRGHTYTPYPNLEYAFQAVRKVISSSGGVIQAVAKKQCEFCESGITLGVEECSICGADLRTNNLRTA